MPAGKIPLSSGVGSSQYLPYGVSLRSLQPYAPRRVPISCQEAQRLRRYLRDAFKIYAIERINTAPTATERRKTLSRIKTSALCLIEKDNLPSAYALLAALKSRDYDALRLAYRAITAKGHMPFHQIKRRLPLWTHLLHHIVDPRVAILGGSK